MNFSYQSLIQIEPGSSLVYEGHEVVLKARTLIGDYLFAELGDEHEDLYILADKRAEIPALHFHVHPELPLGSRADLLDCPWLFHEGDFESESFASSIFNQVDKKNFTYKQLTEQRGNAQIQSWDGEGECPFAFGVYHCKDSVSSSYFIICEYGDGFESQICCMIGDELEN